jgi:hypothetical protein
LKIEIGKLYISLGHHVTHFLYQDPFKVTGVDGNKYTYTYSSDGWETSRRQDHFTSDLIKPCTKLDLLLLGVDNVEMD